MAAMWTLIIKNNSGSNQIIEDLGIEIANGTQVTLSDIFDYDEIAASDSLRDLVNAGLLIVNDGTSDLSAQDGVNYLTLMHKQVITKDYYTKAELQQPGNAIIDWNNIVNKPQFASPKWVEPVKFRALGVGLSVAPTNPTVGDFYVDAANTYFQWDGTTWVNKGTAVDGDRVINLADADIHQFNGTAWAAQGQNVDNTGVLVDDDGDGKPAQYVYDGTVGAWIKISDIDWGDHFDGGPSKHDASEIDVEGSYINLSTADLETVIGEIDTNLTDALTQNLDKAYRGGRIINTDLGPVVLDRGTATTAPLQITPKAQLPTSNLQDGQLDIKDGILCIYDANRGKWLSVQRMFLSFGRRGWTLTQYLNFFAGTMPSNNSGFRLARDACVVSVSVQLDKTSSCDIHLRRNDTITNLYTISISNALGNHDTSVNLDLNAGDFLQCFCQTSTIVEDPLVIIELAWRL